MSEITSLGRIPRRRADAVRSISAILDAAVLVLRERPEASVEDIARTAKVSRQTVYAHFSSRTSLLRAVIDRITTEAGAAMDAAELDHGPAAEALLRLLDVGWSNFERYPFLLDGAPGDLSEPEMRELHQPVVDRLERLIRRGQDTGEFDRHLSPGWLLAAAVGLGRTAGDEIGAGRMSEEEAADALRRSILRLFGVATGVRDHGADVAS